MEPAGTAQGKDCMPFDSWGSGKAKGNLQEQRVCGSMMHNLSPSRVDLCDNALMYIQFRTSRHLNNQAWLSKDAIHDFLMIH